MSQGSRQNGSVTSGKALAQKGKGVLEGGTGFGGSTRRRKTVDGIGIESTLLCN